MSSPLRLLHKATIKVAGCLLTSSVLARDPLTSAPARSAPPPWSSSPRNSRAQTMLEGVICSRGVVPVLGRHPGHGRHESGKAVRPRAVLSQKSGGFLSQKTCPDQSEPLASTKVRCTLTGATENPNQRRSALHELVHFIARPCGGCAEVYTAEHQRRCEMCKLSSVVGKSGSAPPLLRRCAYVGAQMQSIWSGR